MKDETFRINEALRKESEITHPFMCDNPYIEMGIMETKEKNEAILILINYEKNRISSHVSSNLTCQAEILLGDSSPCIERKIDETIMKMVFDPNEVKILHLKC